MHTNEVEIQRIQVLMPDLPESGLVAVNTGNPGKLEAVGEFAQAVITLGHQFGWGDSPGIYPFTPPGIGRYEEPKLPSALETAFHKARWLKSRLPEGEVAAGADGSFWAKEGHGDWNQWFKLDREGGLSQERIASEFNRLRQILSFPQTKDGLVRLAWENAIALVNGRAHGFSEMIFVLAKPMPVELLKHEYTKAVQTGLVCSSSARIGLIEVLADHGLITKMAVVPTAQVRPKMDLKSQLKSPREAMLNRVVKDVCVTIPHALLASGE